MSFKTGHLQVDGSINIDGSLFFAGVFFEPSLNLSAVNQDYLPKVGSLINIGASINRIDKIYANDVYISQNSLWVNGKKVISDESDVITVSTSPNQDLLMLTSGSGSSKVQSATGVLLNVTNTYTSKDIELRTDSNSGSIILDANGNSGTIYGDAKGNIEFDSKATLKLIGNSITFDASNPLSFTNLSVSNFTASSALITGDTSMSGTLHVGGHAHIGGNLTVDGSLLYTNISAIDVSTAYIRLNDGLTGTPPSTLQSGIIVGRGSSNPYVFVFDEDLETFRIGISQLSTSTHYSDASTQAVATREDTPVSYGIGYWNGNTYRIETSAGFTFTPGTGLGLPIATTMGSENTALVWNGTTIGSRDLGTMAFETSINYYSKTMVDGLINSSMTPYATNSSVNIAFGYRDTSITGAYAKALISNSFSKASQVLTLTQKDGTTLTAQFDGAYILNSSYGNVTSGVLPYRTFGTAANSNTGDFVAARTFGTAANSNTGDFLAAGGTAVLATAANLINGTYTGGGGAQPPSYIPSGQIRFNMMNAPGNGGYYDFLLMDTYAGGDVPYVTALGIAKQSGVAKGILAVGAKAGSTWSYVDLITSGNISSQSVSSASSAGLLNNSYAYTNGTDGWFRTAGSGGWYHSTYAVGITATEAGYVDTYNSAVFRAPNFKLSSDASLKTKIQPIDIKGIDVEYKQFELKARPGETRYGVIAQDLEKVNPELVTKGADGMLSVSYIDLLIKEIVALKARVEQLEKLNQ